jgi:hypothetical protein
LEKLAQIESQLDKCLIKAPISGQVVYPEVERWRRDEGAIGRERVFTNGK